MIIKFILFFFILGIHSQFSSAAFFNFKKQKNNSIKNQVYDIPFEITEFISSYLIENLYQIAENQKISQSSVRNNVINTALINKNFYQGMLQSIFNHHHSDNFFKRTIHHKDKKLKKLIDSCKNRKKQNGRILSPPLITALCFKDQINDEEERLLKELIPFCQYICTLRLENFEIQKKEIAILSPLILNLPHIRSLKFFNIQFFHAHKVINKLIQMNSNFKNLEELNLIQCQFKKENTLILAKLLKVSQKLKKLSLRGNPNIGNAFLKFITYSPNYQDLEALDLSETNLQPNLIRNLHYLKQPISLKLSGNPSISNCLTFGTFSDSACSTLKFLDLSFTKIQLDDIKKLSKLKSLTHIDLSYCPKLEIFSIEELSYYENIVKTLQTLNISNNPQIEFHPDLIFILSKFKNLQQLILCKDHQSRTLFLQGLKKEMPKIEVIFDQQIEFSYLKKFDSFLILLNFIFSTTILYSNSGSTHLLENYFSPIHAKIVSNSLKFFYLIGFLFFLTSDSTSQIPSTDRIYLLYTLNAFILFLESELL